MALSEAFIAKYQDLLGNESGPFFAALEGPVDKGFRLNPLKANQKPLSLSLEQPISWSPNGYFGQVAGKSIDHTTGLVYSQEPSAQFVAEVLAAQPGEKVLDLAAAPGGKSTQLAGQMKGQGLLWTNEIFFSRAKILSENIERLGVQNAIVSSADSKDLAQLLPDFFDRVLLDSPCSGEGMFRKDPEAITYWSEGYPRECAERSEEILANAVAMVKPGGVLVYSTCTFAPEEDEQTIAWLLATYPEFELLEIDKVAGSGIQDGRPEWADGCSDLTKTARLWPQDLAGEGHFVAKLRRKDDEEETRPAIKGQKADRFSSEESALLQDFLKQTVPGLVVDSSRLLRFGDRVFLMPVDCPAFGRIKILRAGLCLGSFKKKRFEPDHALALAIQPDQAAQTFAIDDSSDWQAYIHGEALNTKADLQKGFVLMTAGGNGVGWAKFVNGQLKNFYPKGLRH
ncbi:RsmF rRNA methyltransferase first C-terminal domain-containing protein [Fructobacillus sp. M158]|uniref:RsmF rRNA methyltransferase first C-terminal domain-containing protein n=1 Tax=Fructobacillus parabroussonetiae TaxID=2713174 RepID=UPI00200A2863|nr:RsmF rRNA methyltransferase first C-terminal domain-containing protein [Fructobacillus parabroussonetiae]MCK8617206.1 RsmF rRNA methyltransferase first C-terminal domain-containing protein [Fructobacillus parabroussonetiae]